MGGLQDFFSAVGSVWGSGGHNVQGSGSTQNDALGNPMHHDAHGNSTYNDVHGNRGGQDGHGNSLFTDGHGNHTIDHNQPSAWNGGASAPTNDGQS